METVKISLQHVFADPIGVMTIVSNKEGICQIGFGAYEIYEDRESAREGLELEKISKIQNLEAVKQMEEYFQGKRKEFDLKLSMKGTEYQRRVWMALQDIPYGETRSYQEIAIRIESPRSCRAVGMANNKNPIAIVVPCHRVIGSNKKLVGYGGGLDKKQFLLELERANMSNKK